MRGEAANHEAFESCLGASLKVALFAPRDEPMRIRCPLAKGSHTEGRFVVDAASVRPAPRLLVKASSHRGEDHRLFQSRVGPARFERRLTLLKTSGIAGGPARRSATGRSCPHLKMLCAEFTSPTRKRGLARGESGGPRLRALKLHISSPEMEGVQELKPEAQAKWLSSIGPSLALQASIPACFASRQAKCATSKLASLSRLDVHSSN